MLYMSLLVQVVCFLLQCKNVLKMFWSEILAPGSQWETCYLHLVILRRKNHPWWVIQWACDSSSLSRLSPQLVGTLMACYGWRSHSLWFQERRNLHVDEQQGLGLSSSCRSLSPFHLHPVPWLQLRVLVSLGWLFLLAFDFYVADQGEETPAPGLALLWISKCTEQVLTLCIWLCTPLGTEKSHTHT